MDLVKLSAVSGVAVMATLASVSTSREIRAEPLFVEPHPPAVLETVQVRIDDAARPAELPPTYSLPGPAMSSVGGNQMLPIMQPNPRLPLVGHSVERWSALIEEAAQRFGIPADWVRGVMQQESGGRTHLNGYPITSSAGAMGLMQVMPATFAELRARHGLDPDPREPRTNIMAGAAYLRDMYDRYGPRYFLAAYNAGPARVDDHLRTGRPLPYETRAYNAVLMPTLVQNAVHASMPVSGGVQDLTGVETLRAAPPAPSRSDNQHPANPSSASVFVASAAPASATTLPGVEQPRDGLFVTLRAADRRRTVSAVGTAED